MPHHLIILSGSGHLRYEMIHTFRRSKLPQTPTSAYKKMEMKWPIHISSRCAPTRWQDEVQIKVARRSNHQSINSQVVAVV